MNTKIVYVLISNEHDTYLEQTLLSVYSAKMHMPNIEIILLMDNLTNSTLIGYRNVILDYITTKVVVEIEGKYTNQQRSRILKTSIIEHVKGDFLFVDSDTIITNSFEEMDSFDFDIGAVSNLHLSSLKKYYNYLVIKKRINEIEELIDIDENRTYFNSGVLYVKDNDKTRIFFRTWNDYWRKGNVIGISVDQPSFMIADVLNNHIISELPGIWNCQMHWGLKYLYNSKIIHYFSSNIPFHKKEYLAEFTSENLYLDIKMKGYIDDKTKQILRNPYNYFDECTLIICGQDVIIWNSASVRLLRFLYRYYNKLFNIIEFLSKCADKYHNRKKQQ
jgi:hypothetical protein